MKIPTTLRGPTQAVMGSIAQASHVGDVAIAGGQLIKQISDARLKQQVQDRKSTADETRINFQQDEQTRFQQAVDNQPTDQDPQGFASAFMEESRKRQKDLIKQTPDDYTAKYLKGNLDGIDLQLHSNADIYETKQKYVYKANKANQTIDNHIQNIRQTNGRTFQRPTHGNGTPADYSSLGSLSSKYESNGKYGATFKSPTDGKSYGKFQISSKTGTMKTFIKDLQKNHPDLASKLTATPNTPQFNKQWEGLKDNKDLQKAQYAFAKKTHYDAMAQNVKSKTGYDVNAQPRAIQEAIFSTAIQHGPHSSIPIKVIKALGPNANPRDVVNAIYYEREKVDVYFKSQSPKIRQSIKIRLENERQDALRMLTTGGVQGRVITPKDAGDSLFTNEIDDMIDGIGGPASARREVALGKKEEVAVAYLDTIGENDPASGLASLDSGTWNPYISDGAEQNLRRKFTARAQKQKLEDKAKFTASVKNASQRYLDGADPDPEMSSENLQAILGPEKGQQIYQQLRQDYSVGQFRKQYKNSSQAEMKQFVKGLETETNDEKNKEGYPHNKAVLDGVKAEMGNIIKARNADPAGTVLRSNPVIQGLMQNIQKAGTPEERTQRFAVYAQATLGQQKDLGIKNPTLYPKEYLKSVVDKDLKRLSPKKGEEATSEDIDGVISDFTGLKITAGDYWGQIQREIKEAGLPNTYLRVLNSKITKSPGLIRGAFEALGRGDNLTAIAVSRLANDGKKELAYEVVNGSNLMVGLKVDKDMEDKLLGSAGGFIGDALNHAPQTRRLVYETAKSIMMNRNGKLTADSMWTSSHYEMKGILKDLLGEPVDHNGTVFPPSHSTAEQFSDALGKLNTEDMNGAMRFAPDGKLTPVKDFDADHYKLQNMDNNSYSFIGLDNRPLMGTDGSLYTLSLTPKKMAEILARK